jgi:hypothetical protein
MKARMARPNGHHQTKPRIISAIQAGFPNSSILAAIGMAGPHEMNVNNIYIAPSNCQEGAIRARRLLHLQIVVPTDDG